jgi:ubiquinone/menaquinone biosynthesis C-methylase UbiE
LTLETFQLNSSAAAIYEEQKVPAIFLPLAEATLDAVPLFGDDSVLDVACGTGIVARKARERVGPSARIVGVDLNEGMIGAARNLTDTCSRSCEWHTADVTKLPFEDGTFSVAFCQQGLQFFPDQELALREIKRVLQPDGRIALTVWSEANDLFKALAESFRRHVSDEVAERSLAPFNSPGADALSSLVSGQGFSDVSARVLTVERVLNDPENTIPKEIMGNPIGLAVLERGDAVMRRIVYEVIEALSGYRRGLCFVFPTHTHLIEGKVVSTQPRPRPDIAEGSS